MVSRKLAALAAVSLVFAGTTAAAQSAPQDAASKRSASASRLSVAPAARAGTKGKNDSQLAGPAAIVVGVVLVAASVWGLTEATKGHRPDSP